MLLKVLAFLDDTPSGLLNSYWRFEESQCLHIHSQAVLEGTGIVSSAAGPGKLQIAPPTSRVNTISRSCTTRLSALLSSPCDRSCVLWTTACYCNAGNCSQKHGLLKASFSFQTSAWSISYCDGPSNHILYGYRKHKIDNLFVTDRKNNILPNFNFSFA